MKLTHLIAAGLMVTGLTVSTAASAQNYRGDRYDQRDHRRDDRRDDRRYDRGHDRGRYYGRDRHRNRCHTEWRHHRQIRVCNR